MQKNRIIFTVVFCILLAAGCGKRSRLVDKYYSLALKSRDKGEISESIDNFKKVVSLSPNSAKGHDALYNLADVYIQIGKFEKGEKLLELYLDTADLNGKELLDVIDKIGFVFEKHLHDNENALKFYKRGLDLTFNKEDRIKFLVKVGNSYFNQYQFQEAVEYLEKAADDISKLSQKNALSELSQQAYYYLSISYAILARDVKDRFQGGESYIDIDRDTIDKCIETLDKCLKFSEKTKYGILCNFQKADALIEIDEHEKALLILEDLLSSYPHKLVIENRIERIKGMIGR